MFVQGKSGIFIKKKICLNIFINFLLKILKISFFFKFGFIFEIATIIIFVSVNLIQLTKVTKRHLINVEFIYFKPWPHFSNLH